MSDQRNPMMVGIEWRIKEALVVDAGAFQSDEGEPLGFVKLAFFGGLKTIMVDPDVALQFETHKGEKVFAEGPLWYEQKKDKVNVKFEVTTLKPIK